MNSYCHLWLRCENEIHSEEQRQNVLTVGKFDQQQRLVCDKILCFGDTDTFSAVSTCQHVGLSEALTGAALLRFFLTEIPWILTQSSGSVNTEYILQLRQFIFGWYNPILWCFFSSA